MLPPLLRLPLELRLHIYDFYAQDTRERPVHHITKADDTPAWKGESVVYEATIPALLLGNRQIYHELKVTFSGIYIITIGPSPTGEPVPIA
jgi:hypothetical protein